MSSSRCPRTSSTFGDEAIRAVSRYARRCPGQLGDHWILRGQPWLSNRASLERPVASVEHRVCLPSRCPTKCLSLQASNMAQDADLVSMTPLLFSALVASSSLFLVVCLRLTSLSTAQGQDRIRQEARRRPLLQGQGYQGPQEPSLREAPPQLRHWPGHPAPA